MKALHSILAVAALACAVTAQAAFTQPTAEQIAEAAENPNKVAALLQDATPEEAAAVLKAIYEKILTLNLDPEAFTARIALVTGAAFKAMPSRMLELASALGTALGGATELAQRVARIVVAAAATAAGPQGAAVSRAFVDALAAAYPAATAEFLGSLRSAGRLPSTVLSSQLIAQIAPVGVPGIPPIIKGYPAQSLP